MFKQLFIVALASIAATAASAQDDSPAPLMSATVVAPANIVLGDTTWIVKRAHTDFGILSIVQNRGSQPLTLWDEVGGLSVSLQPQSAVSLPCGEGQVSGAYQVTDSAGFNASLAIGCGESLSLLLAE